MTSRAVTRETMEVRHRARRRQTEPRETLLVVYLSRPGGPYIGGLQSCVTPGKRACGIASSPSLLPVIWNHSLLQDDPSQSARPCGGPTACGRGQDQGCFRSLHGKAEGVIRGASYAHFEWPTNKIQPRAATSTSKALRLMSRPQKTWDSQPLQSI